VRGDIQIMRHGQTTSFLEWLLGRRRPPAALKSTAQPRPAVAASRPPPPLTAIAGGAVPVAEPAPVVTAVPVLALVPEPAPVMVAVSGPEAAVRHGPTAQPVRARPGIRVLVIASDRRFRAVAATLLTQRGYTVAVGGRGEDITELAVAERADVVIIDASASLTVAAREAARLGSLRPRVGVVAVSDGSGNGLAALPVLPKWSSFDEVFEAIDRVRAAGSRAGAIHVTP
jgi:hypothetical protein